jgi:hypothetical protein
MLAAIEPSAPLELELLSRSATSLKLRWRRPTDFGGVELLGYRVYVAEGNQPFELVADAASNEDATIDYHEHLAQDLTADETYKFKISAYNIVGEGESAQLRTG